MPPKNCDTMKPDCYPACSCQTDCKLFEGCHLWWLINLYQALKPVDVKLSSSCHQAVTKLSPRSQPTVRNFKITIRKSIFQDWWRRKCWDDESCDFQNVDQCQHTFARFNSDCPSQHDCLNPMSTVRAFFFESIGINSFWFSANTKWNIFIWNNFHCNVVLLHIPCFCREMKFHRDISKNRNLRTNFSAYYCQYPERHIQPHFEYNYHNGV